MTVVVEKTPTTLPQATPNGAAPWHVRAGAFAIDVLPGLAVAATMALTALTVPPGSAWRWLCACLLGLTILLLAVNRLLLPTITGWSLGRALTGIRVVRRDGSAIGPWRLLVRDF